MKNVVSLLFVLLTLGVSMPLFAGDLIMSNDFSISASWSDTYSVDMSDPTADPSMSAYDTWSQGFSSRGAYEVMKGVSLSWEFSAYNTQWGYDTDSEDAEFQWQTMYATWEANHFTLDVGYVDSNLGTYASTRETGGFALEIEPVRGWTVNMFAVLDDENAEYDYIDDDFYYAEYDEDTDEWTYSSVETNGSLTDDDDERDSYSFGFSVTHDLPTAGKQVNTSDVVDWVNEDEDEMTGGGPGGMGMDNAFAYYLAVAYDQPNNTKTYATGLDAGYTVKDVDVSAYVGYFFGTDADEMSGDTVDVKGMSAQLDFVKTISEALETSLSLYYTPGNTFVSDDETFYANWEGRGESNFMTNGGGVELLPMTVSVTNWNGAGAYAAALDGTYSLSKSSRIETGFAYAIPVSQDTDDLDNPFDVYDSIYQYNLGYTYEVSTALELGIAASWGKITGNDSYDNIMWGSQASMKFAF